MTYQLVICELILVDGKQWQQWMVIRPYWICPCGSQRTRVRHTVALKQYSEQTRTAQRCRVERTVLRPLSPFPFPRLVCCRSVPGRELGLRGMGTAKNNMRPTDEIKAAQHNTTHRSRHCERRRLCSSSNQRHCLNSSAASSRSTQPTTTVTHKIKNVGVACFCGLSKTCGSGVIWSLLHVV